MYLGHQKQKRKLSMAHSRIKRKRNRGQKMTVSLPTFAHSFANTKLVCISMRLHERTNQWTTANFLHVGIAINLLLLLFLTHFSFPRAQQHTRKFFHLSYYNPQTEQYGCGTDDLPYVALWLVVFTGLRVAVMDYILAPLARKGGIRTKKGLVRFQEQAWLVCYCICSWSFGMVRWLSLPVEETILTTFLVHHIPLRILFQSPRFVEGLAVPRNIRTL